jgi:hypothetical protein
MIDQGLGLEAAEDLGDGAALDLESLGQRQDGTIVALGGGAEDDGLGIAELDHEMIPFEAPLFYDPELLAVMRGAGSEIGEGYVACSSLKAMSVIRFSSRVLQGPT